MKKFLAILLALLMVLSLAACSGGKTAGDAANSDDTANTDTDKKGAETDIKVSEDTIKAAAEEARGPWEQAFMDEYECTGDESYTWGFIDMGFEDTFTTKIRNTFTSYCSKYYPNVTVLEGDGQLDPNVQLELTENYIAQGVDAIIIIPQDADGCVGVVDTCIAEGMPLVCCNSVINSDQLTKAVGYVGSDNYESGKLQAEWLIANVDDTETVKICYQRGSDGYDHTFKRHDGLFETLDAAGYNYEVIGMLVSEYMRDIAMNNAEDWATSLGDEIDVVACCNDESAMGTLQAFQAAGLKCGGDDGILILGIDANQDCLKEVQSGSIACTVFQNAMGQAKWAAISAYDACTKGSKETVSFAIPFETVDATNVADYLD